MAKLEDIEKLERQTSELVRSMDIYRRGKSRNWKWTERNPYTGEERELTTPPEQIIKMKEDMERKLKELKEFIAKIDFMKGEE